jgi:hypothetical protein
MARHHVALSISAAEDMAAMGRMDRDVDHALNHFLRALLTEGTTIVYGGDYRLGGFAERIQDLVRTYAPGSMEAEAQPMHSFLAWPYANAPGDELVEELKRYVCFHQVEMPDDIAHLPAAAAGSAEERLRIARSLSHQRGIVNAKTTAHIFMGGKMSGYRGFLPGVLEEFLLAVKAEIPIFLTGAFGGVASQLITLLRGQEPKALLEALAKAETANAELFALHDAARASYPKLFPLGEPRVAALTPYLQELSRTPWDKVLNNGLSQADNERLFSSLHPAEMVALVMKGMKGK